MRTARHTGNRDHAIADRADVPEFQRAENVGRGTGRLGGDRALGEPHEREHQQRT
jgi:hypothetical protein